MYMRVSRLLSATCLILWILFSLFPFFWTLLTSIKLPALAASVPPAMLFKPSLSNYVAVITGGQGGFYSISQQGFWKYALNSIVVAGLTTVLTLILGTMSSYYVARLKDKSEKLSSWFLSLRMMPSIAVIIPFYIMMGRLGLVDSRISLIIVYTVFNLPLSVWLISAYIRSIPVAYEQMALIDGLGRWGSFWRIIVPLSKPAIVTTALLVFISSWNEFLFALILTGFESKTLPVLATGFITQRGIIWGQLTATAMIIMIPILVLALLAQSYLVKGLTLGIRK